MTCAGDTDTERRILRIEDIRVADRHRRDLGDLAGLAESIAERGLLHSIVVTPDHRLVAGQRRLEACRSLGWTEVPVNVAVQLNDARLALEAERDENTCRLDMTPSEKVALGLALEELERPAAAERKAEAGKANLPTSEEKFPPLTKGDRTGKVYDLVGEAVGMSGPTYKRAKAVVRAAGEGDPVAVDALAEMDRTGKVTPAYQKLTNGDGRLTRDGSRKRPPQDLVANVIEKLLGISAALGEIDTARAIAADVPLQEWDRNLTEIIVPLHRLRGDIRKVLQP